MYYSNVNANESSVKLWSWNTSIGQLLTCFRQVLVIGKAVIVTSLFYNKEVSSHTFKRTSRRWRKKKVVWKIVSLLVKILSESYQTPVCQGWGWSPATQRIYLTDLSREANSCRLFISGSCIPFIHNLALQHPPQKRKNPEVMMRVCADS